MHIAPKSRAGPFCPPCCDRTGVAGWVKFPLMRHKGPLVSGEAQKSQTGTHCCPSLAATSGGGVLACGSPPHWRLCRWLVLGPSSTVLEGLAALGGIKGCVLHLSVEQFKVAKDWEKRE